jgi:Flp pilus assembly protein TadG
MVGLVDGKRGAVTVQFALFLPILVIILIGAFEIWKILYVKDTLNDAAYQGVRLLCMQPNREAIEVQTEALLRRSVAVNSLVGNRAYDPQILEVDLDYRGYCGEEIYVTLKLNWTVGASEGWGRPSGGWLTFLGRSGRLTSQATGWVLCEQLP